MIEEGLLDVTGRHPVAAYGIHVGPGPIGTFMTRPGAIMAGANELHITVNGAGGHGSRPGDAHDPVPALVEIAAALQTMVTRRFSVFDPVVVTVTQLHGGDAINVIPPAASLGATVRTLSAASIDTLRREARQLADGIATAHGCTAEVQFIVRYPVTINDAVETDAAVHALRAAFGDTRVVIAPDPAMASEDFSYVLNEVPGTFLMLSCSPPDVDLATAAFNHSPHVLFDDAVLADQAAALALLAISRLGRAG